MKIFPAIDIKDKKCVRLVKGDFDNKTEYEMSPVEQASKYKDHGFKNLHIVDLDGALTGETTNLDIIKDIVSKFNLKTRMTLNIQLLRRYGDGLTFLILGCDVKYSRSHYDFNFVLTIRHTNIFIPKM